MSTDSLARKRPCASRPAATVASSSDDARSNSSLVLRPVAAISSSSERENALDSAAWWMRPFHTMRSRRRWISRARTGTSSRRCENTVSPEKATGARVVGVRRRRRVPRARARRRTSPGPARPVVCAAARVTRCVTPPSRSDRGAVARRRAVAGGRRARRWRRRRRAVDEREHLVARGEPLEDHAASCSRSNTSASTPTARPPCSTRHAWVNTRSRAQKSVGSYVST